MYKGYNKIFWGIIITILNIKVGRITILPAFIGFIIILNGINLLYKETNIESFNKAKIFAIIMGIVSLIDEVMNFLLFKPSNFFISNQLEPVFYNVIKLLMVYKIFEGSIEYLNNNVNFDLALENTKDLKCYIIASTISIMLLNFNILFNTKTFNIVLFFIFGVLNLYLILLVYHLKRIFA